MPTVHDVEKKEDLNQVKTWAIGTIQELRRAPAPKQILVGASVGWMAGYIGVKVSKAAALAIGGTLLLAQIAHYQGYIDINWSKLQKEVQKSHEQIRRHSRNMPAIIDQLQDFIHENVYLAGGFVAGFFLGVAV